MLQSPCCRIDSAPVGVGGSLTGAAFVAGASGAFLTGGGGGGRSGEGSGSSIFTLQQPRKQQPQM